MRPSDVIAFKRMCLENWHPKQKEALQMVRASQSYFVAAEMTDVAMVSGESLPVEGVPETVVPSRAGFMLFDRPLGKAHWLDNDGTEPENVTDIIGVMWQIWTEWSRPEDNYGQPQLLQGTTDDLLPDNEYTVAETSIEMLPLIRGRGVPVPGRPVNAGWYWSPGHPEYADKGPQAFSNDDGEADHKMIKAVIASWLLMGQTLAWVEREHANRVQRKLARRIGLRPDVTVIKLRKIDRKHDEQGGLVEWTHRWLVSGHWRQQWYPSAHEHRPMWISPHIKGPPDKPLVTKDRVIALVR